jgi:hypothetical protein
MCDHEKHYMHENKCLLCEVLRLKQELKIAKSGLVMCELELMHKESGPQSIATNKVEIP